MRYEAADWDRAVETLAGADSVAVACHVNPDGDALGSLFAAAEGLKRLGKRTFASWGDERAEVPFGYRFLPGVDTVVQPADVPETDAFLALDCGSADRPGSLEARAQKNDSLINIDHHPGNDKFGSLNIVVETASSTAEIVIFLLKDLGVEIDTDI